MSAKLYTYAVTDRLTGDQYLRVKAPNLATAKLMAVDAMRSRFSSDATIDDIYVEKQAATTEKQDAEKQEEAAMDAEPRGSTWKREYEISQQMREALTAEVEAHVRENLLLKAELAKLHEKLGWMEKGEQSSRKATRRIDEQRKEATRRAVQEEKDRTEEVWGRVILLQGLLDGELLYRHSNGTSREITDATGIPGRLD